MKSARARPPRRWKLAIGTAATALLLASCSGSAISGQSDNDSQEDTSGPITVGASVSLSGVYSQNGIQLQNGYQLWVKHINESGGLLGRKVELVLYDDKSQPQTSAKLYERLITQDSVDLIVGPYSSAVSAGMAAVAERHQMLTILPVAASTDIYERYKWAIQLAPPADKYNEGGLQIAKKEGYQTLYYAGEDSEATAALAKTIGKQAADYGMDVVNTQLFPKGTTSYSALVQNIIQSNPDAVFAGTYAQESVGFTRDLRSSAADTEMLFISPGAAQVEYQQALGDLAEGVLAASLWEPTLKSPGNAEFVAAYKKQFNGQPGYRAAAGYATMQILGEAVTECQCLDQARLRDVVQNLKTETVFGKFCVDSTGVQQCKDALTVQWLDGKKEIVWPFDRANREYVLPFPPSP